VPLQLNFRWNSHIAQAKDTFRSLIYRATLVPSCTTHIAADLAGNDVTMTGQYSATQGDSFSVVSAVPLVMPVQDYGTNGLQEVIGCWKQGSTSTAVFEDFPTATFKFKVVDVSSFVIGSKDVPAGDPSVPRTLIRLLLRCRLLPGPLAPSQRLCLLCALPGHGLLSRLVVRERF
jgi:hypothetical protein